MNLTPRQFLLLTQLTDSMFPSGGFVHSEGLETYVQSGDLTSIEQLEGLLITRLLYDWSRQDMVALHTAMSAYLDANMPVIHTLDERLTAMKMAKETRQASSRVGRQTLRTMLLMLDDSFLRAYQKNIQRGDCKGHQAIVFGLTTASIGIAPQPALTAYAYNIVSSQVSIALKLMRFGQTQAQQLLWHLQPTMEQAVTQALSATMDEMTSFVPALDIRAMQHEYLFRRLFNS